MEKETQQEPRKEEEKTSSNQPQIRHEAEVTRQTARYRIPASIEIDGKMYRLYDWSVSGCGIRSLPHSYIGAIVTAKIYFDFDDFTTILEDLKLEVLNNERMLEGESVIGARFVDLNKNQQAILNQIISAYLVGDIVTEGDIIQAVSRQITYPERKPAQLDKKRSYGILGVIYSTVAFLVLFLLYTMYVRIYVVPTINAYVDANLTEVRAPAPSYIQFLQDLKMGMKLHNGDPIAVAHLMNGGIKKIDSRIEGKIYKVNMFDGDFRNVGEPIVTLLPSKAQAYIVAEVFHKYLDKIAVGQEAYVKTVDGREFKAKITEIVTAESASTRKSKILASIYATSKNYDKVILEPEEPLEIGMIDESLYVTIDTFWQ